MLQTRLTTEYGIDVPIVSAGMAFVARAPLAGAVSAAGGLGVLGATAMPPEVLQADIDAIRARTDRPFGANFIARFGAGDQIELCARERVPVVVFYWDPPEDGWVDLLRDAGTKVWMQVGSPDEAAAAVGLGVDALVIQGTEGGGHNRSTATTMSLLPVVVDQVSPVPVLAAGGIADGRAIAAALALGAEGVWIGSRFLASAEADIHPGYQERVVAAGVTDTVRHSVFGFEFPDAQVRGIRNGIVSEFEGRDRPPPYEGLDPTELEQIGVADLFGEKVPLSKFGGFPPTAAATGDLDQMSLLAGESVGMIDGVEPAAEIVGRLAAEAEQVITDRLTTITHP